MQMTEETFRVRDESMRKKSFIDFMAGPTVRLLLSMIPSNDHPEAMKTLLEEAFNHGWKSGSGSMTLHMLEAMMKPPSR